VRKGGRIVCVATIIAVAVNRRERRAIVGLHISPSEAETFWASFLKDLEVSSLTCRKPAISNAHESSKAAIPRIIGATGQRCRVHFMHNGLAWVPERQHTKVSAVIRSAFIQPDRSKCHPDLPQVATNFARLGRTSMPAWLARNPTARLRPFSTRQSAKLHSTSPLELLNKVAKQRADLVGILLNEDSVIRLVAAVLTEQDDEWPLQHR
jgi:transposase-like protein